MILFNEMNYGAVYSTGIEPQQSTSTGEIICDAMFWNPVLNAID